MRARQAKDAQIVNQLILEAAEDAFAQEIAVKMHADIERQAAKAKISSGVSFTKHAKERMLQRGISIQDVLRRDDSIRTIESLDRRGNTTVVTAYRI